MTPQIVFKMFQNLGKYVPATGYYKLAINGIYWEARDLQADGGITFYDFRGETYSADEVWSEIIR